MQLSYLTLRIYLGANKIIIHQTSFQCLLHSLFSLFQTILEEDQKFFKLLELLGQFQEMGSVLVFVDKQEHADELMKDLMKHSYPCMSLHGGIDQYDRGSIISDFKNGNVRLLVNAYIRIVQVDFTHFFGCRAQNLDPGLR